MVNLDIGIEEEFSGFRDLVRDHSRSLSSQLQAYQTKMFPPHARKTIRNFSPAEAEKLFDFAEGYLRTIVAEMEKDETLNFKVAAGPGNRRTYSVDDLATIRKYMDAGSRPPGRYLPHRREREELQVLAVMNFKGGSGKTTTSAHLAQFLALRGYRVLAMDLDPQASLSALFGSQPELDVKPNDTIYGAIRYDDERRPIQDIVRETYIPGLHLIPGNLELMEFEHTTPMALANRGREERMFFSRVSDAIEEIQDAYDVVVIDCPPQLGYLTLSALTAATAVLITVHPQMLDVMSMSQFLVMMSDLMDTISDAGAEDKISWMRYLVTRFEPTDGPQHQMLAFLRSMFGGNVMVNSMVKSTAISDAGLTNQTLFEVDRSQFTRSTYDRALESMTSVNAEIEDMLRKTWGRK
jgi:chromosome partitioning protein